jgi:hypothetical protein
VLITLMKWVTIWEYWIVAEWNLRYRFGLVFEMVYWKCIKVKYDNCHKYYFSKIQNYLIDVILKNWINKKYVHC